MSYSYQAVGAPHRPRRVLPCSRPSSIFLSAIFCLLTIAIILPGPHQDLARPAIDNVKPYVEGAKEWWAGRLEQAVGMDDGAAGWMGKEPNVVAENLDGLPLEDTSRIVEVEGDADQAGGLYDLALPKNNEDDSASQGEEEDMSIPGTASNGGGEGGDEADVDELIEEEVSSSTATTAPSGFARLPIATRPSRPSSSASSSSDDDTELPPCARTYAFDFRGQNGFASEFNRFLKIAAVSSYHNYTLIVNSNKWIYGTFEDYFVQPALNCSLSQVPRRRHQIQAREGEELLSPDWASHDHVQDWIKHPESKEYTDALYLAISIPYDDLEALHTREIEAYPPQLPLSGMATVPGPMWEAFRLQAEQAKKWWKLNEVTQGMVDKLEEGLGWDLSKAPLVGVHIRLGDKCSEQNSIKYTPLRFANATQLATYRSHHPSSKSVDKCGSQAAAGGLDPAQGGLYIDAAEAAIGDMLETGSPKRGKPILGIMSDDDGAVEKLVKGDVDGRLDGYEVVSLPERAGEIPGADGDMDVSELGDGFQVHKFAELPLATRIVLGRRMIRDLTLLSTKSDALVNTGSSNVGRLMMLLGGFDRAKQGKMHSCDTRFFPTAHFW